jgi:multiple sugar transport system permease protein
MGKRRRPFSTKSSVERFFLYFVLIAGAAVCLLPLVWMLRSSLMTSVQIFELPPRLVPHPFRWSNYGEALTILPFGRYFVNSIAIVVLVIVGTVITSSLCAYSFARIKWRGRDLVFSLIVATMMLPYAVTLIPTFVGWSAVRLTNTFGPLIIPAWFGGGAFYIFLLRQFYRGIPRELDEAARIDGANHVQIYSHIMVPLTKTSLIVVGLFAFLNTWNDFLGPLVYLNSSNKYTLALGLMQFTGMYKAEWHLMMAAATVVVAPAILIFLVGQRYFIEGIALTGIKG